MALLKRGGIVVFLCGPPCSGKTTQAKMLAQAGVGTHVEPSRLMETIFASGLEQYVLGDGTAIDLLEQRRIYDQGELPDQRWVSLAIRKELESIAERNGSVIFSGIPRTIAQAQALLPFLESHFRLDLSLALLLDVPVRILRQRAAERRRDIDQTFERRLEVYKEETCPAFSYLELFYPHVRFDVVDGSLSRETLHACILHQQLGGC